MDLLQESSSIWDEFLRRPCPRVDLLSFWPLAPSFPWHPWHLLNSGTLAPFCPLTPLVQHITAWYSYILYGLWFPDFNRVPGNFKIKNWYEFLRMTTVLYCTVMCGIVLYCTLQNISAPFNQKDVSHYIVKLGVQELLSQGLLSSSNKDKLSRFPLDPWSLKL